MKLGNEEILLINALNSFSGVDAVDCIIKGNRVTFMVKESDIGNVIGRNGSNIKKLRNKIRKDIDVFAYSADPKRFIKNVFRGIEFNEIELGEEEGKKNVLLKLDSENKRKIMNETNKLKKIKELMQRHYNVNEIRIR
ncbi:NusA-like transcription termination signal-binding factor [Candidatus Micrarchaeota archaeon]|nr:NusA-like transcription termination signal-binding factor [Candidatus Micrarchaeota archaeon]